MTPQTQDPLGWLRQGTAGLGALAKPLDAAIPGAGSVLSTMMQLNAMALPTYTNYTPINPYNANPMGQVGYRNYGGGLDADSVKRYLYGGSQDTQLSRDAFKVNGSAGADTNYREVDGTPALLTKDEVVAKRPNGENYVLSDNIKHPITGKTLAEMGMVNKKKKKQAEERAKQGDTISKKTVQELDKQFEELVQVNEVAISQMLDNEINNLACGGKIKKYQDGGPLIHKVQKGDTLYDLGKKYKVPYQKLAEYNKIVNPRDLQIGTELSIPKEYQYQWGESKSGLPQHSYEETRKAELSKSPEQYQKEQKEYFEKFGILPALQKQNIVTKVLRNKIDSNLLPYNYPNSINEALHTAKNIFVKNVPSDTSGEKISRDEKESQTSTVRSDILNLSLGFPQEYGSFEVSPFRPSNSKNSEATYLRLKELREKYPGSEANPSDEQFYAEPNSEVETLVRQKLVDQAIQYLGKETRGTDKYRRAQGLAALEFRPGMSDLSQATGEGYTLDLGKDERGNYVSYWDIWDYAPKAANVIGKPVELYDRIYYDPKTQKVLDNQFKPEGYTSGGTIHIKDSKKGTFTKAAKKHGKSVQSFASQVLANPDNYSEAMRKKAQFAHNAKSFKHQFGGATELPPSLPVSGYSDPFTHSNVSLPLEHPWYNVSPERIQSLLAEPGLIQPKSSMTFPQHDWSKFGLSDPSFLEGNVLASKMQSTPQIPELTPGQVYNGPSFNYGANSTLPTITAADLAKSTSPATTNIPLGTTKKGSSAPSVSNISYVPGTEQLTAGKQGFKGYGVKEFQDWAVNTYGKSALPKYGNDAKWGPETEAAWNKYGKAFLTAKGDFKDPMQALGSMWPVGTVPTGAEAKVKELSKGIADKQLGSGPNANGAANFGDFQKYLGDVMQGLSFAGQLGNLGATTLESVPRMSNRQLDPAMYEEALRAARNSQMRNTAGSYTSNQAGQQAAYAQYLNQLTSTLQNVDTTNKQLATQTQDYNNQAQLQEQTFRLQALAARDAAKQGVWGSFANAGQALNEQYSNKVGQAALASAYPLVYEGMLADMNEFLKKHNKTVK